jgi:glycosyltransferase involved in cell wall biosynthesis
MPSGQVGRVDQFDISVPSPCAPELDCVRGCGANPVTVVAIPARDEEDRIGACIQALARQTRRPDAILVLLNNCTDRTEAVARGLASSLPCVLRIIPHAFPPHGANAGNARRLAMHQAAHIAGSNAALLTTDADTIVADDWVDRNVAALQAGADAVCGRVHLDAMEAALIPSHLHEDDALECELTELLDKIACILDPAPPDPWPRHTEAAGASIGVTVSAFRRAGGIPSVAAGEDRAFITRLARMDARIRHDPAITVTVSGRLHGRAPGGMADTIRRRMQQQDEFIDDALEPAADAYRRVDFRRRVRLAWRHQRAGFTPRKELAADLGMSHALLQRRLNSQYFGAAWTEVESASPFLVRRRVRFTELPRQIAYARQLLEQHQDTYRDSMLVKTNPCS